MKTSIISPNVSLRANPIHADQMLGSHGDGDFQCQTEHTAGNSAITPWIYEHSSPGTQSDEVADAIIEADFCLNY